ncbi:helix-turn-helix domain-containing protein [bacterium]
MCPYAYYEIMRNSKDKRQIRYQIITHAEKNGIKSAARAFRTTANTVRRWKKRYEEHRYSGLYDKSKKPKSSPKQTSKKLEEKIVKLKKKYKRMSAEQIRILEDISVSAETMRRLWRKHGINNRRRRKHETKRNLREVKKELRFMGMVCEDTKELKDIPEYYPTMMRKNTPKHQYTFRDVTTGMMYLGFANEKSLSHSTLFAEYMNTHLTNLGVSLSNTIRQTDNGSEYIGSWNAKEISSYTRKVESIKGQKHFTIPPRRHRWQADVETVHDIIEREWYEIESFNDRKEFMNKAYTYQLYFNLKRINTYKESKTPWQLAYGKVKDLDIRVAMIPPVDLDVLLKEKINNIYRGVSHVLTNP